MAYWSALLFEQYHTCKECPEGSKIEFHNLCIGSPFSEMEKCKLCQRLEVSGKERIGIPQNIRSSLNKNSNTNV